MTKKIKYIQLESGAYPRDSEWLAMNDCERGVYHSLITFIACEEGKLLFSVESLKYLCNTSAEKFEQFWKKYSHKFIKKDNFISHKRVDDEIKKARKKSRQSKLAAEIRWSERNANALLKGAMPKRAMPTKTKAKYKELGLELNKQSIIFDDKIQKNFGDLNKIERVTFRRIRLFLFSLRDLEKYKNAIDWIAETKQWGIDHSKNNIEVKKCFVSKIKKMGWIPKKEYQT